MRDGKPFRMIKGVHVFFYIILLCCVLFTACGRRGDPVAVAPYDENPVEKKAGQPHDDTKVMPPVSTVSEKPETKPDEKLMSDIPAGLTGVYTGNAIVITWDEIIGLGVRLYKVYRSSGDKYEIIGETVTPAFKDTSVEKNKKYHYKVTAVGINESAASGAITILTESN